MAEAVDSGVPAQPRDSATTRAGAQNRAVSAKDAGDRAVYGVGIEGGVEALAGGSGLYLIMWAVVTNGRRRELAAGPTFRLPGTVADRLRAGEELGPIVNDELGTSAIGERDGAAGVLTAGAIDRESALVHAVAGAFAPFVGPLY